MSRAAMVVGDACPATRLPDLVGCTPPRLGTRLLDRVGPAKEDDDMGLAKASTSRKEVVGVVQVL